MNTSIFRTSSTERLTSPEQLNDYLKVSNPRIWVILAAAAVLLFSFLVWGIFGELPTTVTVKGVAQDGEVYSFVNPDVAAKIVQGDQAIVQQEHYKVAAIADMPLSRDESYETLDSDYARSQVTLDEWNVRITLVPNENAAVSDGIVDVTITTEKISPIRFLTN